MKLSRVLRIAMVAGTLSAGALHAQISESQPAEFPPASFKGKQYVDSKGCVFVRAGIDGNVSWVPRVSRDRKAICGFKPSLAGQVAQAAPAPAPGAAPEQITIEATPAPAPTPRTAPRPAPVATAQRAPVAVTPRAPVVVRQTAPTPKPRVVRQPVVVAAPTPVPVATAQPAQVASSCPGASALSQQYLRGTRGAPVRCGPQAAPIVGAGRTSAPAAAPQGVSNRSTAAVSAGTRIVPRHVAHNRVNTTNVAVPQGYRKVWDDGRLNPKRAEQNLAGRSDMLLVWTQTVPRRLIDTRSGRDVTASVPLIYPYTDVPTQRAQLGEVSIVTSDGQVRKRIVRNAGAKKVRQPVYSSRSAPKAVASDPAAAPVAQARAVQGKSYVQIGTYRNPANAQAAAQKVARMGMRARIGKHRKGGQTYMTVQAGPFAGSDATGRALRTLRRAGYGDAFARN